MEHCQYRHSMTGTSTTTTDIISDLPDNVVENILMCLPIKDAVKTSLLSTKWRYKWAKLPQLIFDDTFSIESPEEQQLSKYKLLLAINQTLLLHWAPILKFTLSISGLESCLEIDQIILFLSRNGIEDITLHIRRGERHKLPCHLFSCQQLRHLNLHSCVFQPPPTFRGFTKLTSLELREVTFAADVIGSCISNCPLLERLILESFITPDCLEINAPNLKYLRIRGIFNSLCFKSTALLSAVSVTAHVTAKNESLKVANSSNLIVVLDSLPCVENLELGYSFFLKLLAAGSVPKRLPTTLNYLKYLYITNIYLMVMDEVAFALCMITSSPNLVKVIFELHSEKTDGDTGPLLDFMKAQDYSDVALNQLRELLMVKVSGTLPELEFIKLMLARSPKLERMLIKPISGADVNRGFNILKEITRFQRASPKAEVIYLDPNK